MSLLHSPRTPWVMLGIFCCAVLVLFFLTIGSDVGRLREVSRADEIEAVKNEVRMPIVFETNSNAEKAPVPSPPSGSSEPAEQKHSDGRPEPPSDAPAPEPQPEAAAISPALPGKLLSHSFKQTGTTFEASFRTDRAIVGAKTFFKANPALWAVDLSGQWTNLAPRVTRVDNGVIEKVVIGKHDDFLRVVFRYRDKKYSRPDVTPEVLEEADGFTVRFFNSVNGKK